MQPLGRFHECKELFAGKPQAANFPKLRAVMKQDGAGASVSDSVVETGLSPLDAPPQGALGWVQTASDFLCDPGGVDALLWLPDKGVRTPSTLQPWCSGTREFQGSPSV